MAAWPLVSEYRLHMWGAQADLWPEFRSQPRQSVSPIARADAATDPDHYEGIGEAVAVVHRPKFLFVLVRSSR
jgi:hypothetical protein